ncbi:MAG: hypothetical protein ACJATI_003335 [Halioglobus sp.]|jgi:hypothetical protein
MLVQMQQILPPIAVVSLVSLVKAYCQKYKDKKGLIVIELNFSFNRFFLILLGYPSTL